MKRMAAITATVAIFAIVAAFLFWKCKFGFGDVDEVFYLCLPYRLWQGDALLVHEWSLQQLSAVPMLPLVYLHMAVFRSTDGMVLHFRYLFVLIMLMTALYHYFRWRRYNAMGAFVGSLAFMMSVPFGIMALSYNSMGIIFFSIAVTAWATNEKHGLCCSFLVGIMYGLAVLACPFLVLVYPVFVWVCMRRQGIKRTLIPSTLGGGLVAVFLIVFVFSRASFGDIVSAVPNFFTDPHHANKNVLILVRDWIGHFLLVQKGWSFVALFTVGAVAMWRKFKCRGVPVALIVDRRLCAFYVFASIAMLVIVIVARPWVDFFALPICVTAVAISFLNVSSSLRKIVLDGVMPGFMIGFCTCMGTNQGSYLVASVMFVSIVPAMVAICRSWQELDCAKLKCRCVLWIFLALLVIGECCVRYTMVWEDGKSMSGLCSMLTCGPEKGIVTRKLQAKTYAAHYGNLDFIRSVNPDGMILFHMWYEWMYLCLPNRIGAYSAWCGIRDSDNPRLKEFWRLNKDRVPSLVCLPPGAVDTPFAQYLRKEFGIVHSKVLSEAVVLWK